MKKPKFIPEFDDIPTPRAKMPELALEERRLNFDEVELGFAREMALAEAARCLSCRRCIGCGLCLAECDREAIVYDQKPEVRKITVDAVVLATGSEPFDAARKPDLGYAGSHNVVTTLELERILSPTGPYGGLPLRPGDGAFPRRVAFVQCVGSREEVIGANYCSATCCTEALNLALELVENVEHIEVTIFHRGMRPLGREGEGLHRRAEESESVEQVLAEVLSVSGEDSEGRVMLKYDAGEGECEAEFDMVVLSVGQRASKASRAVARQCRIGVNKFGYAETGVLTPVCSSEEGVFVVGACAGPRGPSEALTAAAAAASSSVAGKPGELGHGETRKSAGEASDVAPAGPEAGADAGPEAGAEAGPETRADRGPVVLCLCEYGLAAGGLDPAKVAEEVDPAGRAAHILGFELACVRASLARIGPSVGESDGARLLVVGCHPDTHTAFWRERISAACGAPSAVHLMKIERGMEDEAGLSARIGEWIEHPPVPAEQRETTQTGLGRPEQKVLVIGGGISGITAALDVASRNIPVTLVERTDRLGGRPGVRAALDPEVQESLAGLVERAGSSPVIDVRLNSHIVSVERKGNSFVAAVDCLDGEESIAHGALIVATGARDFARADFTERSDDLVITQTEFAERLREDSPAPGNVVVVQCVGSRTPERPYCSRTCCADALLNILRLKEKSPETQVTVLHKGIRLWGFDEEMLSDAMDLGVRFVRVESAPEISSGAALEVHAIDADSGGELSLGPDLVVFSTGIEPSASNAEIAQMLGVSLDSDGFFLPDGGAVAPVESGRTGVYLCGRARGPAAVAGRIVQAQAAAGKACLLLQRGAR